jgi:hypothetical protein
LNTLGKGHWAALILRKSRTGETDRAGGLEAHLDLLVSVGGNYVRNTMSQS